PEDFFAIQARKFAVYHMEDPQVFYNKEDLWGVPRRTVESRDREMEPYFTIMRLPGEPREEFILLTLFNPSRRDNMIAWLAARSDPPSYGRLVVYNFPKQKNVYGPRLIDARIDQDPIISQQLSLWNQRGSTVIRGALPAMPTVMSHAIAALALGPAFRRAGWPARVWWAAAICAAVPDADVLGVFAGVPLGSLLGHRGLTHSLAFAAALAAIVTPLL